ncbi:MAG TPA: hypothetical protein VMX55_05865 [candidate division Zixibacteria bacterium]|nr:hypothetical protein [candidate division Zixibacteria bacterium]
MFKGTFNDLAEIASKNYDQHARELLEEQINFFMKDYSKEEIKQLGLPQVLMFLTSSVAKCNKHKIIEANDVLDAFAFLRYIITREFIENLLVENNLNIGLPLSENLTNRLSNLLKVKGDMKTKSNLDGKVTRLTDFLKEQKLHQKHINRIEVEIRATILLLSRLIALSSSTQEPKVKSADIDTSYDIVRYIIFKLDTLPFKILRDLYAVDNEKIWSKIPTLTFDQSTHDHLSSTAYARWESLLPETFETLKKHLNCSIRPFLSAIHGYSEIFCAKKSITRISSEELLYILEDFEKFLFGNFNPIEVEDEFTKFTFTKEGLDILSSVSKWLSTLIVDLFGKDEFVFKFSSTIPRHMSLLLFISIVEKIKSNGTKINIKHIASAITKWVNLLKELEFVQISP